MLSNHAATTVLGGNTCYIIAPQPSHIPALWGSSSELSSTARTRRLVTPCVVLVKDYTRVEGSVTTCVDLKSQLQDRTSAVGEGIHTRSFGHRALVNLHIHSVATDSAFATIISLKVPITLPEPEQIESHA